MELSRRRLLHLSASVGALAAMSRGPRGVRRGQHISKPAIDDRRAIEQADRVGKDAGVQIVVNGERLAIDRR